LLYKPDLVPVGKDQKQHIEMTRDIAITFNQMFGETFKLPEPDIKEEVAVVPGTDGQKMSKSYGNTIEIFAPEKQLKKQVMGIVTDSTPVEDPKDPDKCNVFTLYKLLANNDEIEEMRNNYISGGYGYGNAKKTLFEKVLTHFSEARERYNKLIEKPEFVREILEQGAKKAKIVASTTLDEVKEKVGYK